MTTVVQGEISTMHALVLPQSRLKQKFVFCIVTVSGLTPTTDKDSIFRKNSVFLSKVFINVIILVNLQLIGVEMWTVDPLVRLPRSRPFSRRPTPHSPPLLLLAKRETASRTLQCPRGQNVERTGTLTYIVK